MIPKCCVSCKNFKVQEYCCFCKSRNCEIVRNNKRFTITEIIPDEFDAFKCNDYTYSEELEEVYGLDYKRILCPERFKPSKEWTEVANEVVSILNEADYRYIISEMQLQKLKKKFDEIVKNLTWVEDGFNSSLEEIADKMVKSDWKWLGHFPTPNELLNRLNNLYNDAINCIKRENTTSAITSCGGWTVIVDALNCDVKVFFSIFQSII